LRSSGSDDVSSSDLVYEEEDDSEELGVRILDSYQKRDIDLILNERAKRFYDPRQTGREKEKCILVAVDIKQYGAKDDSNPRYDSQVFSHGESLDELSELVGTAGLKVEAVLVQKLSAPNMKTYVGPGKINEIMDSK
jgi:hypothetical protein